MRMNIKSQYLVQKTRISTVPWKIGIPEIERENKRIESLKLDIQLEFYHAYLILWVNVIDAIPRHVPVSVRLSIVNQCHTVCALAFTLITAIHWSISYNTDSEEACKGDSAFAFGPESLWGGIFTRLSPSRMWGNRVLAS